MSKLQEFLSLGDYYASNGGYLEKKSNAYLDDFKKNAGYNNYTRFARDVNSWGQPGCQKQPWCAEYQFWKLVKVIGITNALKIMGGGFYNCQSVKNWSKNRAHGIPLRNLVHFRFSEMAPTLEMYRVLMELEFILMREILPVLQEWWQMAERFAISPIPSTIQQSTDMFGLTGSPTKIQQPGKKQEPE